MYQYTQVVLIDFFNIHMGSIFYWHFSKGSWLLRALLGKYLLNYRYSYRHYYVKAVEYLIKDFLKKNKVTIIIILAYLCPKSALIIQQNSDNIENV